MNYPSKFFGRNTIMPCFVLCLSVLNLCTVSIDLSAPGIYVSVLGLLAVVLYVFDIKTSSPLLVLWTVVQLTVIKHSNFNATIYSVADVWDPTQGLRLSVYFPIVFNNGLQAGLNLVAVFLLALLVALRQKALLKSYLTFTAYRQNNSLGIVFPLKGRAERWVTLSGEKDWLLVNLLMPFSYKNKTIWYVLIRRNDKQQLIKNQSNQLVFFKPVTDVSSIGDKENNKVDFEDEVWALCK